MHLITVLVLQLYYNIQNWLFDIIKFYFSINTAVTDPTKYVTKNYNVVL